MRKWKNLYNRNTPRIYQYGSLPGTSGNYFSTPDSVAASVVDDFDIVVTGVFSWSAGTGTSKTSTPIGKWDNPAGTAAQSFILDLPQVGVNPPVFYYRVAASSATLRTATATANIPTAANTLGGLKVSRNGTTGVITFSTRTGDSGAWTQLGTTIAGTAGTLVDSATELSVGAHSLGVEGCSPGKPYRIQIYNGINGTLAVNFNPNNWTTGTTWPAQITGETWTINGTATVVRR